MGCRFITLDVSDEAAWDALEREVPHVDVLVNNAGITGLGDHGHKHDPTHRFPNGGGCMRSIWTAHFWAAAMPSAR
jgi:NAD(P)-dependent dehydrogenase (short-subunit alcohol dehydrogenase family)